MSKVSNNTVGVLRCHWQSYLYYNVKPKLLFCWLFIDFIKFWHINFLTLTILQLTYILFVCLFSHLNFIYLYNFFNIIPDSQTYCSCLFVFLKPTVAQILYPILIVSSLQFLYLFWPTISTSPQKTKTFSSPNTALICFNCLVRSHLKQFRSRIHREFRWRRHHPL